MKLLRNFLLITGTSVLIYGCHKPGCTDYLADNYNPDATQDDFTCSYNGDMVFWMLPAESQALVDAGHDILRFEIDGAIVDSIATASFASVAGTCDGAGTKTFNRTFVGSLDRSYKYKVKGLGFTTLYEGFVKVEAGECTAVQLQ
jgi:hypothetical protein